MTIKEWEELEPGDILQLRSGIPVNEFRKFSIFGWPFHDSPEEKECRENMDIIVSGTGTKDGKPIVNGLFKTESNYFNSWWFRSEWFDIKKKYKDGTYPVGHLHYCAGEHQLVKILAPTPKMTLIKKEGGEVTCYDNIYVDIIRKKINEIN